MRPGQQNNKRMRGRNNNHNNNGSRKGPNPLTRSYESNGPDVKVRGTALHIAEKYIQLARDAFASGDYVMGENYQQHAEHYYRIIAAAQGQFQQPAPTLYRDEDDEEGRDQRFAGNGGYSNGNRYGQPQVTPEGPQPFIDDGESRPQPEARESRENREHREVREGREPRDTNERRDGDYRDARENREPREHREGRESRLPRFIEQPVQLPAAAAEPAGKADESDRESASAETEAMPRSRRRRMSRSRGRARAEAGEAEAFEDQGSGEAAEVPAGE